MAADGAFSPQHIDTSSILREKMKKSQITKSFLKGGTFPSFPPKRRTLAADVAAVSEERRVEKVQSSDGVHPVARGPLGALSGPLGGLTVCFWRIFCV